MTRKRLTSEEECIIRELHTCKEWPIPELVKYAGVSKRVICRIVKGADNGSGLGDGTYAGRALVEPTRPRLGHAEVGV